MDVHHLRYFLAVCKTNNFTKAASNCNVSQPALSRAIRQLEEEVGGQLFRRERDLTHITDLGMLLRPHFERIIGELSAVKIDAKRFLTLEQANVNLGIMCTVGPTRFTTLLSHFSACYPGISLQITEGVPKLLSEKLTKGELDVAIMASSDGFPERFDCHVLFEERFVIAFPTSHRFAALDNIPIAQIDGENYLRRINCEYRDYLSKLCDDRGADVHLGYASEREDWIQNMVAGGLGICFIPEFSAVIPGLETRPVTDPEVSREVCLVTMAGRRQSPAVASFVKAVRELKFPASRFSTSRKSDQKPHKPRLSFQGESGISASDETM
jgi:LysR family transcriptional regulator, hydrogen peroxide-inducible genes activator